MQDIDYTTIVKYAWTAYDSSRPIKSVEDISAKVSTNHVYRIRLQNGNIVIAKLSYFGKFEHFVEDHTIINVLNNNLPAPFENFLSSSLMKGNQLFVHRFLNSEVDVWVIFYRPIKVAKRLPRQLKEHHIKTLGKEFAMFHKECTHIVHTLPSSSKSMTSDLYHLLDIVKNDIQQLGYFAQEDVIKEQCDIFFEHTTKINARLLQKIPVFVDWNIGNFSVTEQVTLFSRWDYDWFRVSSKVIDFYFLSRIVSAIGDRTVFTYNINPMMEERFILFLKSYHELNPLNEIEIRFLKEVYRFFLLNYVIKYGRYFFAEKYADKLQKDAFESHFPSIEKGFDADYILKQLGI